MKDISKVLDYLTANLAALFLVPSELDHAWVENIQRLLAWPTTSKFKIDIKILLFFRNTNKNLPKLLMYSKFKIM